MFTFYWRTLYVVISRLSDFVLSCALTPPFVSTSVKVVSSAVRQLSLSSLCCHDTRSTDVTVTSPRRNCRNFSRLCRWPGTDARYRWTVLLRNKVHSLSAITPRSRAMLNKFLRLCLAHSPFTRYNRLSNRCVQQVVSCKRGFRCVYRTDGSTAVQKLTERWNVQ